MRRFREAAADHVVPEIERPDSDFSPLPIRIVLFGGQFK